jgi:hypothetical protein
MAGRPRKRKGLPHFGSGIDENGHWEPAFPGQRAPLPKGHTLSTRHGAYAVLQLQPRAKEIADLIRPQVIDGDRYEVAVESAAMIGARLERAFAHLAACDDPDELRRFDQDCSRWSRLWLTSLAMLGLTPASAARILRDAGLGKAAATSAAMRELTNHIAGRYAVDDEEVEEEAMEA